MKALQHSLPFLPKKIKIISDKLGVVHDDTKVVFYNASGPIYMCDADDKEGIRIAQGMLVSLKLARPKQIASVLGVNTSTVHRNWKKYQKGGVKAFSKKTSERTPYKMNDKKCDDVQIYLNKNFSIRTAAKKSGLSEGTIRNGLKRGDTICEN
jgi:transposase